MASRSSSLKKIDLDIVTNSMSGISLPEPVVLDSLRSIRELDAAAVMIQKVYKSCRTRRDLAECAAVIEELWWKALEFTSHKPRSVEAHHESISDIGESNQR